MTRIFRPGQLKQALLEVLADVGPANGYALMRALEERIGQGWRSSPGAIYPALVTLEAAGLVRAHEDGDTRLYSLTPPGERAAEAGAGTVAGVARRNRGAVHLPRLSTFLDRWAASSLRHIPVPPDAAPDVERILDQALADLAAALTPPQGKGHRHG